MASRLKLQDELESVLGSRNVYFQPPESVKMQYDAIVYSLSNDYVRHADNKPYMTMDRYDVTVISRNPDNDIAKRIKNFFKYSSFDRRFITDNLYHDTLTIYY